MSILRRCFADYWSLRRLWLPLLFLVAAAAPLSMLMPLVEKRLVDKVLIARQLHLLLPTLALYGSLWLGSILLSRVVVENLRAYLDERFSMHMRERVFAHCESLSLTFFQEKHSAQIVSLFFNDIPSMTSLLSGTVVNGFASLVALCLGIGLMLSLNWQLALATGLMSVLALVAGAWLTRPLRSVARQLQVTAGDLVQRLQETLSGIREILAFGQEEPQRVSFVGTLQQLLRLRMRISLIQTGIGTGTGIFGLAVAGVIYGYGGYLVVGGVITVGTLIAMQLLYQQIAQPINSLFTMTSSVQKALGAADRIYALLDQTPQVREREDARQPVGVSGTVAFENVSFAYQPERHALEEVFFQVEPGETIALVGPSGAGKTTLVSLILRLYDPQQGRVLLDGVDIRDFTLAGLRGQIGVVFQDTFLFATTIRENIAIGRPNATPDEIEAAARAANAWEFIVDLPHGLDTAVGERGVQLSQGQRQRLAIARAFLRDPRILILDEPTSALDARSEQLLQLALAELTRGRTTFVIAHRLATVRRADRILVLEQGRIVEQGTHGELLRSGGLYHELFDLQFGGANLAEDALVPDREGLAVP